jgi:uridine kinase
VPNPGLERAVLAVAERIVAIRLPHPVRVAIDGNIASGKSTFSALLADALAGSGRQIICASIDGFHRPSAQRYRRGRYSPEGYYEDARDLGAVKELLLEPLGPDGSLAFVRESFDLVADSPAKYAAERADADAILLFDGTFLQRSELRGCFDFRIFLDVPESVARSRGTDRDTPAIGTRGETQSLYDQRYLPAFRRYERESAPRENADIVIRNWAS